jgi:hypothetical protein
MLSARGVSRAGAILPFFQLKLFITFANIVLIHKFLQCEILQRVLHGKSAFSGLTVFMSPTDTSPNPVEANGQGLPRNLLPGPKT